MLKYSIAAVALVASSTFAMADPNNGGPAGGGAGAGGATMERSGSAPGGAMKDSGSAPSKTFSDGEMKMKGDRSSGTSDSAGSMRKDAASDKMQGKANRQQATDEKLNTNERNRQAEDNDRSSKHNDRADRNDRNDRKNSDQAKDQSRADKGATGAGEGTEGKARPKGSLTNVSPEQKTRVRAAWGSHRVEPARGIGIAVNVGVVVPRSVHFYPVPEEIVSIVPDYSGYEYFMIDEAHVAIVDPDTLEVVDIIVIA
ncbi:DUF1236 domain-containing protein [Hyphomicrobium sp.]|uniref:DUF1236 domain-containing protein n=1 Tax=Hyphomicrobium sp. TaxID=82 RepID=UPI00356B11DF